MGFMTMKYKFVERDGKLVETEMQSTGSMAAGSVTRYFEHIDGGMIDVTELEKRTSPDYVEHDGKMVHIKDFEKATRPDGWDEPKE